ncbi:PorT family protein [Polaribacter pectinis]|uniref:PorT family protein n=1 Tax=Polaribacter pectinis TaxID=2738844 RepID=A0A7G9L9D9_9FLAO|nr:porin family protein [Polaribacter pectinis]QNM85238.1 PorT family protein [Polaribacter pectinis]
MNKAITTLLLLFITISVFSQRESLNLGDRYAEDQIYASVSFAQFDDQPSIISKSSFSYSISTGFIKDFILNKQGSFSIAAGVGYGFDLFNHKLKVEEINNATSFSSDLTISGNIFKSHNLEFPLEIRWRTSTANRYDFWRVYAGIKFMYNLSNKFQFEDSNNTSFQYSNVSAYNNLQYGLTLSAGYDEFNINIFYGLTPIFNDATINGETINTKILKFGLIFYIL